MTIQNTASKANRWLQFALHEALVYSAQTLIFGLVCWFFSHFFAHKERMELYVNSKVTQHTGEEFLFTLLAISVVLGALAFVSAIATRDSVKFLSREVLLEAPRTIYFFGSTIASTGLALALYLKLYPAGDAGSNAPLVLSINSVAIALVAFIYGCGLKGLLEHGFLRASLTPSVADKHTEA